MSSIQVRKPSQDELKKMNVESWPVWEKEKSQFDWEYSDQETCYLLEGQVEVKTDQGETAKFGKGDLVVFPKGLKCEWNIKQDVKKHYRFGD